MVAWRVTASPDVAVTGTRTAMPTGSVAVRTAGRLLALAGPIDWTAWPAVIMNDRCSSRAAAKRALPSWAAMMAHLPGARVSTVVPDTAQASGVVERNDTSRREDADADSVTGIPAITPARVPAGRRNVIPCGVRPVPIWKVRARPATRNGGSPGWVAVIVQAPALTAVAEPVVTGPAVMVLAETVHTAGVSDRNVTASPDDAFAVSGIRAPTCVPGGWGKETSLLLLPGADLEGAGHPGRRERGVTGLGGGDRAGAGADGGGLADRGGRVGGGRAGDAGDGAHGRGVGPE